ncbi:MAG: serine/threonine-protein phosphatase [Candidatus Accumulibacter sp.]|uniref:Serine/threonine-protein phosphatase n=1 Tax=Candidatus Accumulibacter proximus TaxID=2954385 RepID=A0A935PVS4_9PROT|nr:serine/threonine-protein phosphatase [Candidatus Accumulibacter proximus]
MYEVANAQWQGCRDEQQDAGGFTDPEGPEVAHSGVLAVLADGMGGLSHGAAAGRLTVRAFLDAYRRKAPGESIPDALRRSLLATNKAVLDFARAKEGEGAAAATIVAAVLKENQLFWIAAGDSRAYLVRNGVALRLTVDHTVAEDALDAADTLSHDIDPEAVSSFMGSPEAPRMDTNHQALRLASGDCVLLATDGLYWTLSEEEIGKVIRGDDLREDCERLVRCVEERQAEDQDNVTVLMMRYSNENKVERPGFWTGALATLLRRPGRS